MGLTVLDAGIVIAVLDAGDAHHLQAVRELTAARARSDRLILPVSAYAEALVSPNRAGVDAVATVDRFVDAIPVLIEPASRSIGATAAALRARYGRTLRLPDALVVATAIELSAGRIITTDTRWPPLTGVQVDVVGTDRDDQADAPAE